MRLFFRVAVFCCGFLLCGEGVWGQNLVPNGDFETYSQCPSQANLSLDLAYPWKTGTSSGFVSSYFNSCSNYSGSSVPSNESGYSFQIPHSGNGYAAYHFIGYSNYWQYAEVKLSGSLIAGQCYYVSFYVSLMSQSGVAINNIAAHFSNNYVYGNDTNMLISASSDITAFGNPIINDTTNWVQVAGIYTAVGGEQYITIGNFQSIANTDSVQRQGPVFDNVFAPYYLDDVSVVPVDGNNPKAFAGNDTVINQGDSVFIGTLINGLTTEWTDGSGNAIASDVPGLWVQPTVATDYILKQTVCGFVSYDTVHVDVWPLGIEHSGLAGMHIYPNPTMGAVNIMLPQAGDWQASIYGVDGHKVPTALSKPAGGQELQLQLDAAPGVYFVRVVNGSTGAAWVQQVVLQ